MTDRERGVRCDLSVVVPVYREEQNIRPFLARLEPVLRELGGTHEVIFVLDPSPDRTDAVIRDEIRRNPAIRLLVLSRRFGQPAATMAGILLCGGDRCVVMDVDLQDPPELIPALAARLDAGYEVAYAMRRSRAGETLPKRAVSYAAYGVIHWLTGGRMPRNTGDFRMLSRRVIEVLRRMDDSRPYLRGMVADAGFRQAAVEYDREARHAGVGQYNPWTGSASIGLDGVVGTTTRPLRLMWAMGTMLAVGAAVIGLIRLLTAGSWTGSPTPWVVAITAAFFTGVQLIALGLVGEYVGRVHDQVRRRPLFVVDERVNFGDDR